MTTLHLVTAMDTEGPIDDPAKPDILDSWERVGALVAKLFDADFRGAVRDGFGRPGVISWYLLTLAGFRTNPFNRPMTAHEVHDYYVDTWGAAMAEYGDGTHWHHHQPAPSGIGNEWSADWIHAQTYDDVLARLVVERGWFPASFRAGGRIENDDTSWWLEEIIPFDYSSCSGTKVDWDQPESDGRPLRAVCDWSRAPDDWSWYHPDDDDYQAPGGQKRFMFRSPDLESRVHRFDADDARRAFERAAGGVTTVVSFFEHDRRDVTLDRIRRGWDVMGEVASEFPEVRWRYSDAVDAAIDAAGIEDRPAPEFTVAAHGGDRLLVSTGDRIFGRQPFVAVATEDGTEIRRAALLTVGRRQWITEPLPSRYHRGAVAANSPSGRAGVTPFIRP